MSGNSLRHSTPLADLTEQNGSLLLEKSRHAEAEEHRVQAQGYGHHRDGRPACGMDVAWHREGARVCLGPNNDGKAKVLRVSERTRLMLT